MSAHLKVNGSTANKAPEKTTPPTQSTTSIQKLKKMGRSENCKIISKIQEDFAYENGIGRFSVIVADSQTKVNWFQDGKKIDSSNFSILKMEQMSSDNRRCLIVKNCFDKDFCKYTVKTEDGKEEYSAYLTKALDRNEYLQKINNKMFLSGMLDQELNENQSCKFSVVLVNRFANVKWMKDGQPMSGGDYEEKTNENERTLILKNCKQSAEYSIQCGSDKMSAHLKVNGSTANKAPEKTTPPAQSTTAPAVEQDEEESMSSDRVTVSIRPVLEDGPWKKDDEGHWKTTTIIKKLKFMPLPDPLIRAETLGTKWAYDGARWAPIPASA